MPDPSIQDLGMSDTEYAVVLPISVKPEQARKITQFISAVAEQVTGHSRK